MKKQKNISIALLTLALILGAFTLSKASSLLLLISEESTEPAKPQKEGTGSTETTPNKGEDKDKSKRKDDKNKPLSKRQEIANALKTKNMFAKPPAPPQPPGSVGSIFGNEAEIGGKWYKVGDTIPPGAKITAINVCSVTYLWKEKENTIYTPNGQASKQSAGQPSDRRQPQHNDQEVPNNNKKPDKKPKKDKKKVRAEKKAAKSSTGIDDLDWMDIPDHLKDKVREKWSQIPDEYKEKAKERWQGMSDEERQQAIQEMERD